MANTPYQSKVLIREYNSNFKRDSNSTINDYQDQFLNLGTKNDTIKSVNDIDALILNGTFSIRIESKFENYFNSMNPVKDLVDKGISKISQTEGNEGVGKLWDWVSGKGGRVIMSALPNSKISDGLNSFFYGGFDISGGQYWTSIDPLKISVNCLIDPTLSSSKQKQTLKVLLSTVVPKITNTDLRTFAPPGPKYGRQILSFMGDLIGQWDSNTKNEVEKTKKNYDLNETGTYTFIIGGLSFKNTTIQSVTPTFSDEFTEDGCPTWIQLTIEFQSNRIVTDEMIIEMVDGIGTAPKVGNLTVDNIHSGVSEYMKGLT